MRTRSFAELSAKAPGQPSALHKPCSASRIRDAHAAASAMLRRTHTVALWQTEITARLRAALRGRSRTGSCWEGGRSGAKAESRNCVHARLPNCLRRPRSSPPRSTSAVQRRQGQTSLGVSPLRWLVVVLLLNSYQRSPCFSSRPAPEFFRPCRKPSVLQVTQSNPHGW